MRIDLVDQPTEELLREHGLGGHVRAFRVDDDRVAFLALTQTGKEFIRWLMMEQRATEN